MHKYPESAFQAAPPDSFKRIEIARGYFDQLDCLPDMLVTSGWMFLQGTKIDSIHAYLNGKLAAQNPVLYRSDVGKALSPIEGAGHSGFEFRLPYETGLNGPLGWIDLLGYQGDRPVSQMSTLFHTNLESIEPVPSPELMYRVVNNRDSRAFKLSGVKSFGDFLRPVLQYRELNSLHSMLDWGCGCGRMSMHFLSLPGDLRVHGCDIDAEAVDWCRKNLSSGEFSAIRPYPPTQYADASFDLIIGFSVFTHLARDAQRAWLSEMHRLIRPGGLFLASVHGESVATDQVPRRMPDLLQKGILDDTEDPTLNGIAPDGYYRGVFQTRQYTVREWSNYFDVLDYIRRGVGNRQDLVIMRAHSSSQGQDLGSRVSFLEAEVADLKHSVNQASFRVEEMQARLRPDGWAQRVKDKLRSLKLSRKTGEKP